MFHFSEKDLEDLKKAARPMSKKNPIHFDQDHDVAHFYADSDSSENSTHVNKSVDYSKMPQIFGGRVFDDRPYSERPPIYDPNFYKKPVIKNERKENIIIKPSGNEVSVINKIEFEKHVLEVESIGFGYYSVLTPFTESQQGLLDDLIKHLKDTYALDEAYHDKYVQLKHCQP